MLLTLESFVPVVLVDEDIVWESKDLAMTSFEIQWRKLTLLILPRRHGRGSERVSRKGGMVLQDRPPRRIGRHLE